MSAQTNSDLAAARAGVVRALDRVCDLTCHYCGGACAPATFRTWTETDDQGPVLHGEWVHVDGASVDALLGRFPWLGARMREAIRIMGYIMPVSPSAGKQERVCEANAIRFLDVDGAEFVSIEDVLAGKGWSPLHQEYKTTQSIFPERIGCKVPECGGQMHCTHHESQPIADQVKRTYRCERCGSVRVLFIDVFDGEIRE